MQEKEETFEKMRTTKEKQIMEGMRTLKAQQIGMKDEYDKFKIREDALKEKDRKIYPRS